MLFRHPLTEIIKEIDNNMNLFRYEPYESGITTSTNQLVPSSDNKIALFYKPSIDIKDNDDGLMVTIDLPGIEKEDIKVRLLNPRSLELICEQKSDYENKNENYYIRERKYGSIKRVIALPTDVTDVDVKTSFKNGVLSLVFKKSQITQKEYLKLE